MMPSVCLYFQVHQPYRLRPFSFFDIGGNHVYDDEENNQAILNKIADKCYLPANAILLELIHEHHGDFRLAFSLTGVVMEQLEKYRPDAIESFQRLADTGCVEFLSETYFHSLAFIFSPREFKEQVALHREKIQSLFGRQPVTFRHTELIYNWPAWWKKWAIRRSWRKGPIKSWAGAVPTSSTVRSGAPG
jgi:alpha-amylase